MKPKIKEKKKKNFIAIKNNDEYYLREIKEYFEDKNKYLQIKTNIAVGSFYSKNKKHNQNHSNNIIKYNSEGDELLSSQKPFNTIESKNSKYKKNSFKSISRPKTVNGGTIKSRNSHKLFLNSKSKNNLRKYYEIKSPTEILELFNYHRNVYNDNKQKKVNIYNKADDYNTKKYYLQEKTLVNKEENALRNKILSNYLSNKCNKNKNNLLININNKYLKQKQLINYIYKNKSLSEKFGDYYWLLNLKRSENEKKEYKNNYINKTNNKKYELFEKFFDPGNDDLEYIINPNISENNEKSEKYKFLESFDGLKVDGKNLLEKEFNNFMEEIKINKKNTMRIKLYKDPSEQKMKNIKNLIFKENYLKLKKNQRNDDKLKKSRSASHRPYLINNKTKKENNYIYL